MELPCAERKFLYKTSVAILSKPFYKWFTHLCERLGLENTLSLWGKAFGDYDDTYLMKILSSGWQIVEETPDSARTRTTPELAITCLSNMFPISSLIGTIDNTPPIYQIINLFSHNTIEKNISAYDALHIKFDSLAYLVETLLDQYGKEGELIAYDVVLESRLASSQHEKGSVEEFIENFTSVSKTPDMFSAGLDFEVINKSTKEAILHIKHCEWARYFQDHHPKVGYLMACSTDEAGFRAFNQDLRLQRTKTIMEGGELCDFRVYSISQR